MLPFIERNPAILCTDKFYKKSDDPGILRDWAAQNQHKDSACGLLLQQSTIAFDPPPWLSLLGDIRHFHFIQITQRPNHA